MVGVLFLIGLLAEGIQSFFARSFDLTSTTFTQYSNGVLNYLLSVLIVTLWFAILFRFLPDAKATWKVVITGAFVTSILFNTGKLVFRWIMLGYNNVQTVYGASGSVILIMLFVFYASLILYYGAAFTKIWGTHCGEPIKPLPHAMHYQLNDVGEED
jgi:membrane protein